MEISSSCESLQDYFRSIPVGVLSAKLITSFEFVILQCFDPSAALEKLEKAKYTEFVLTRWKDDPNVIELLSRNKKDQVQARKKFGLK